MRCMRGTVWAVGFTAFFVASHAVADEVVVFRSDEDTLVLTAADFADAQPQFGDQGPGLSFLLAPDASKAFANLTEASIGQTLSMIVCGEVLIEAVIQSRLEGRGAIAMDSLSEATWFAARMRGDAPCERADRK